MQTETKRATLVKKIRGCLKQALNLPTGASRDSLVLRVQIASWLAAVVLPSSACCTGTETRS